VAPRYGTVGGCFLRFPQIGSVSVVTSNLVERYLIGAEDRLESRISHFYSGYFPISVSSAPILREIAETWTIALLLKRFFTQEKENASEWVKSWFEEVDEMLDPLITGSATLMPVAPQSGLLAPWSSTMNYVPTFSILDMTEHRTDPNRISDERDRLR
jgi:hypothetical protein